MCETIGGRDNNLIFRRVLTFEIYFKKFWKEKEDVLAGGGDELHEKPELHKHKIPRM